MRISRPSIFILSVFLSFFVFSCKKDKLLTDGGSLKFSTDTLTFDTVFTEMGSFTTAFKIFNPNDQRIVIKNLKLDKGDSSFFKMNVDGFSGNNINNIEVAAHDSIYVFATVKIDPKNQSNPFVIEDRFTATLNGQIFSIPFIAYGQDAHYVVDSVLAVSDVWKTDKPYVILHSALLDKGKTLTITDVCKIYMNADSRLYVRGQLFINGTKKDSVIFQGDRLDRAYFGYDDYPGEWGGIYFDSTSTGSNIKWTVFKNCGNNMKGGLPFGIEVFGKPGIANQLTMTNTIIENSIGFGLLCFQANVKAENTLVHSTGTQALALVQGGNYQFDNCNFINYFPSKLSHYDEPTVVVLNYYQISNTEYWQGDLTAHFRNCLIYGSMDNELFCYKKGTATYNASFDHCLIKSIDALNTDLTTSGELNIQFCIFNKNPRFVDYKKWNFSPDSASSVIHKGMAILGISNDLNDQPWSVTDTFDIGAYRFVK